MGVVAGMVKEAVDAEVTGAADLEGETFTILPPPLASILGRVVPGGVRFDDLEITGELTLATSRPLRPDFREIEVVRAPLDRHWR